MQRSSFLKNVFASLVAVGMVTALPSTVKAQTDSQAPGKVTDDSLWGLANDAFIQNNNVLAARLLALEYKSRPTPTALFYWALALKRSGQMEKARPLLEKLLTMNPTEKQRQSLEYELSSEP